MPTKYTLTDGRSVLLPDVHCMIEGPPNSGKSHFCASAEKPMLVLAADPLDKLQAYFDRGNWDGQVHTGAQGQPVWIITSRATGKTIIQIEGYFDDNPQAPVAYQALDSRIVSLFDEIRAGVWRTVVVDSWSQLEWIARLRRMYGALACKANENPYFAAKDDLEQLARSRLVNFRCNVIVVFHIETKVLRNKAGTVIKDAREDVGGGELSYSIAAIGQLKELAGVFGECYLSVAPLDGTDNYTIQTRKDHNFKTLQSRIQAPSPCKNEWREIFANKINALAALLPPAQPAPAPAAPEEQPS